MIVFSPFDPFLDSKMAANSAIKKFTYPAFGTVQIPGFFEKTTAMRYFK